MSFEIFSVSPKPTGSQSIKSLEQCFQQLKALQLQRTEEDYAIYAAHQKALGKTPMSCKEYALIRFPPY